MKVIVKDRQEGKTTELLKWLMDGKQTEYYPGWSRAIVCQTTRMVVYTTQQLRLIAPAWLEVNEFDAKLRTDGETPLLLLRERALADMFKAVWSFDDLDSATHRMGRTFMEEFEYAVDDADYLFGRFHKQPAIIALTGELYGPVA